MKTVLAYLAGVIDSEGNVGFNSHGAGREPRLIITARSTERSTLDLLKNVLGGTVRSKVSSAHGKKPYWVWTVRSRKAWDVYRRLAPYLRLKRLP